MTRFESNNDVKWRVGTYSWEQAEGLARGLDLPFVVSAVLASRGYSDVEEARAFLESPNEVPDPFLFEHMDQVVELISQGIQAERRVVVHGDYDADGITATALMAVGLGELGLQVETYLPNRFSEGFGLSRGAVESIAAQGPCLLITVDCGVNYPDEVRRAQELGLDVVVIDHHEPGPRLPDCLIIHPDVGRYPSDRLCGVGLAFKVLHALSVRLHGEPTDRVPDRLHKHLDLVATGTIADLAPLVGENRYYVKEGLKLIGIGARTGFRELAKVAGCTGGVDSGSVAFRIAPRLNAAGRLADPTPPLELLLTEDEHRACEISQRLHELNGERQEVERRILADAVRQAEALAELPPILVLSGEDWHEGVVGIVASRLVERYNRPAILLSMRDGVAKGSGRSIAAYDLVSGLNACADWLTVYGGHTMAVGLTLSQENVLGFSQAIQAHASRLLCATDLAPSYRADGVLRGEDISAETAAALASLGPFGSGNPRPKLLVLGASVDSPEVTRTGGHLRCSVEVDGVRVKAIGFGMGERARSLAAAGGPRALGVELRVSEWQGVARPELVLHAVGDVAPAVGAAEICGPACPRWATHGEEPAGSRLTDKACVEGVTVCATGDRAGAWTASAGAVGRVLATGESTLLLACSAPHALKDLRGSLPLEALVERQGSSNGLGCVGRGCGGLADGHQEPSRVVLAEWDIALNPRSEGAVEMLRGPWSHLLVLDPPYRPEHSRLMERLAVEGARIHRVYGEPERERTAKLLRYIVHPRFAMVCLYKALSRGARGAEAHRQAADLAWRETGVLLSDEDLTRAGTVLSELGLESPVPGSDRMEPRMVPLYADAEAEYEECSRLCRTL